MEKTLILNAKQIDQKLERMVHQLHEVCFKEEEIIICGTHESDISAVSKDLLIKNNVSFIVSEFANQTRAWKL